MKGDIWIGDLIAAWAAVERRPEDLERIVTLLGLEAPAAEEEWKPEERPPEEDKPRRSLMKTMFAPMSAPAPMVPPSPPGPVGSAPTTRVRSIALERLPREVPRAPVWSGGMMASASTDTVSSRLQPLFPHATARALLGAAAHSVRRVGQIDLAEAVRVVAQRRPLRDIPLDTARTMRAGVQLVIDRTWAMHPFLDDITVLRRQIATVVGRDLVDELWFYGDLDKCRRPRRLGKRTRRQSPAEERWQPPDGGIPVIVVSDLGHADRMNEDLRAAKALSELIRQARNAGCDVVTVVPRRIGKHDRDHRVSAVAWDTRTTVGRVLAERGKSRG